MNPVWLVVAGLVGFVLLVLAIAVFNFYAHLAAWRANEPQRDEAKVTWQQVDESVAESEDQTHRLNFIRDIGEDIVGAGDQRRFWLEFIRLLSDAVPAEDENTGMTNLATEYYDDLTKWFDTLSPDALANMAPGEATHGPVGSGWCVSLAVTTKESTDQSLPVAIGQLLTALRSSPPIEAHDSGMQFEISHVTFTSQTSQNDATQFTVECVLKSVAFDYEP